MCGQRFCVVMYRRVLLPQHQSTKERVAEEESKEHHVRPNALKKAEEERRIGEKRNRMAIDDICPVPCDTLAVIAFAVIDVVFCFAQFATVSAESGVAEVMEVGCLRGFLVKAVCC